MKNLPGGLYSPLLGEIMKRSLYVCDGCGKEHRGDSELIVMTTDSTLIVWKKDQRHEMLWDGRAFHFCDVECLKRFFEEL